MDRCSNFIFALVCIALLVGQDAPAIGVLEPTQVTVRVEGSELVVRSRADGAPLERLPIDKVDSGTNFFHWTDLDHFTRWTTQGTVLPEELEKINEVTLGRRQGFGVGLYVSTDPLDASHHGNHGVVIRPRRSFYVLRQNLSDLKKAAPEKVRETLGMLREAGIYGARIGDTWKALFFKDEGLSVNSFTAKAVLDHFRSSDPKGFTLRELRTLAYQLPLEPHPLLEEKFPAINKLLRRKPLNRAEAKALRRIAADASNFKLLQILPKEVVAEAAPSLLKRWSQSCGAAFQKLRAL